MNGSTPNRDGPQSVAQALTRVFDGLATLVGEHIALAREEITAELSAVARELTRALLALPFLLVGYGLLMAGLGILLAPLLGPGPAALALGAANLTLGTFLLRGAISSLSERRLGLESSGEELMKTLQAAREPQSLVRTLQTTVAGEEPGTSGPDGERRQPAARGAAAGSGGDQGRDRAGEARDRQFGAGAS